MPAMLPGRAAGPTARTIGPELWALAPLALVVAMRAASEPTANVSFLLLGLYALLGRAHALRALALSWLLSMANPGIVPEANLGSVGRYAVMFGAAASAILHSSLLSSDPRFRSFTLLTILLGLLIVAHSLLFSPMVDVSVLKALSWTIVIATSVSCWQGLTTRERRRVEQQIYAGLVLVLLLGLPLLVLPAGYLRNGTGFQGILNHPQAFGPTMALLGAWTLARLLGRRRSPWWLIGIGGACIVMVVLSQARIAGLAMLGGVGLALLLAPGITLRSLLSVAPGLRNGRMWLVLTGALIVGVAMAPALMEIGQAYLAKSRTNMGGLMDLYLDTRGNSIERMSANIADHPLTGIGFGIASSPALMLVERDDLLGLPTGAAVEKGLAYLAVLEELGMFGAGLVAFWLLCLVRAAAHGGLEPFAVCLTALLANVAEATLFSPGGMGLLALVLLGWAYAAGHAGRHRA